MKESNSVKFRVDKGGCRSPHVDVGDGPLVETSDGLGLSVVGTSAQIVDLPDCEDCVNGIRSGLHFVSASDATKGIYVEPAARWEQQIFDLRVPPVVGESGEVGRVQSLLDDSFQIKSGCYPVSVDLDVRVTGWRMSPSKVHSVAGWVEVEASNADSAANFNLASGRVVVTYCGGSPSYRLPKFTIPAKSAFSVSVRLGYMLVERLTSVFESRVDGVSVFVDSYEETSIGVTSRKVC